MNELIKSRLQHILQKSWNGRVSRITFVTGAAIYVALILAVWMPAEMVRFVSPQLLWELYLALIIAVTLGSILGICRLYVQRLHDMGLTGYWAVVALAAGPAAILYLSQEYGSWRWELDNNFPAGQLNDFVGYLILALVVTFSLFKGSDKDNKYGTRPDVIALPQHNLQIRWTAILVALICLPYFVYLSVFNDRIWVGRAGYTSMPMTSTNAAGRAFIRCWGLKGVGAYWNDESKSKDSLFTVANGFTKDGYQDQIFDLYINDSGAIDIVTGGNGSLSYREDGFNIALFNPNRINFQDYNWYKSSAAKTFVVTASSYNVYHQLQNETSMSFVRTDEIGNFMTIFTKNLARGSDTVTRPYINGQVMVGNCSNI